jgi:hypothetical protein
MNSLANMKQNIGIQALETKKKHKTCTKRNYKMQNYINMPKNVKNTQE